MGKICSDNVDINVWVPVIINLGYEMIDLQQRISKNSDP